MTNEEKFIVEPLRKWFAKHKPHFTINTTRGQQTGWDIEAKRHNMDLLIEAKYITGPFINKFAGLVVAPLTHRKQRLMKRKIKSWCAAICWAFNTDYDGKEVYHNILDYFSINSDFWNHYITDFNLKYIYFVKKEKVAEVKAIDILAVALCYKDRAAHRRKELKIAERADLPAKEKREIADDLMRRKCKYS